MINNYFVSSFIIESKRNTVLYTVMNSYVDSWCFRIVLYIKHNLFTNNNLTPQLITLIIEIQ